MAEHILAMTLALAKRLVIENQKLLQGEFDQFTPNRLPCRYDVGILGFGGIGRATARLMRAFDMRIYAINHSGPALSPPTSWALWTTWSRCYGQATWWSSPSPHPALPEDLSANGSSSWMKSDAILVNVARGAILDEEALYAHVQSHRAFSWVSMPGGRSLSCRVNSVWNTLSWIYLMFCGSPHNSAMVPHSGGKTARKAAENVMRFLKGEQVTGVVRPEDFP